MDASSVKGLQEQRNVNKYKHTLKHTPIVIVYKKNSCKVECLLYLIVEFSENIYKMLLKAGDTKWKMCDIMLHVVIYLKWMMVHFIHATGANKFVRFRKIVKSLQMELLNSRTQITKKRKKIHTFLRFHKPKYWAACEK